MSQFEVGDKVTVVSTYRNRGEVGIVTTRNWSKYCVRFTGLDKGEDCDLWFEEHQIEPMSAKDDVLLRISDLPKVVRDDRYFPAVRVGGWVFYPDVSVEHALATLAAKRHFDTTPPNYHLHDGDPVPPFGWRPGVLVKMPESECDDCTEPIDATTPTTERTTTP